MPDSASAKTVSRASTRHPAVLRCLEAATAAYRDAQASGDNAIGCNLSFDDAYVKAMPDLSGYQNICDFIACITYAMVNDIVWHERAKRYLYAAQVALGALRHSPQNSQPS